MVTLGRVSGPHGIRGQIKIVSYTEKINGLRDYPIWWIGKQDKQWIAVHPEDCTVSGKYSIAKLREYNDRLSAAVLTGQQIAVPRSHLPSLQDNGEDGYYWADLIGTNVVNLSGEILGHVTDLLETGANDALQIQLPEGTQVFLVPFIDQVIVSVDLSSKEITVDWEINY